MFIRDDEQREQFDYQSIREMARPQLISLSRLWYTILVLTIQLILLYFGLKLNFFYEHLSRSQSINSAVLRREIFLHKFSLFVSFLLLIVFIYPSLFHIDNFANDHRVLTLEDLKNGKSSSWKTFWRHSPSLSGFLHLLMSFSLLISPIFIQSRQSMMIKKNSEFLRRTDLDLLFDFSSSSSNFDFSIENYSRWCLMNFLVASFIGIFREPTVFWSLSKFFAVIYSLVVALNVIQWTLMFGALQLLLKNLSFNSIDSRFLVGYLLSNQPYTTVSLYLLLEFLVYVSSLTFYFYGFIRFQSKFDDRCSNYCPTLIAIIILLLYTACKMPLVHDIFILFIQTRLRLLLICFIFEIVHILVFLIVWIFLTSKFQWKIRGEEKIASTNRVVVRNVPIEMPMAVSLPDLNRHEKSLGKIRIFQSEISYENRPKNWSLPLNHQTSSMAAFDTDDDIVVRSPTQIDSNIYQNPRSSLEHQTKAVFFRSNTPPIPPVKRANKEQVEAARKRAEQLFLQRQQTNKVLPHRHSAALLISQV